jgi:hypothetical protein
MNSTFERDEREAALIDQVQTDAYASGRADEREQWAPVLEALQEALEFVEGYEDVKDGAYGEPQPNRAMTLASMLRETIAKVQP